MPYDVIKKLRDEANDARQSGDAQTRAADGNERLTRTMRDNANEAYARANALDRAAAALESENT